ncbi:hypothetical protein A33M_3885 [Rhodovulum sp. PH10]|nr:hypothetical protein A33M_3885 [Rhodovulum sp. PH10]
MTGAHPLLAVCPGVHTSLRMHASVMRGLRPAHPSKLKMSLFSVRWIAGSKPGDDGGEPGDPAALTETPSILNLCACRSASGKR